RSRERSRGDGPGAGNDLSSRRDPGREQPGPPGDVPRSPTASLLREIAECPGHTGGAPPGAPRRIARCLGMIVGPAPNDPTSEDSHGPSPVDPAARPLPADPPR